MATRLWSATARRNGGIGRLEWDDRWQAARYKPTHPRYYKKTMLRSTVLR
jgi:hypothetical protein